MNNKSFFDILCEHILKIYNKNDEEVFFSELCIKNEKRKFSSTESPTFSNFLPQNGHTYFYSLLFIII